MIVPPKQQIIQLLGSDDVFVWQYYSSNLFGELQARIFRSRIEVVFALLKDRQGNPTLDVGCGPMFISYGFVNRAKHQYIGIDVLANSRLKKYRDVMRKLGVKNIEVVRASAESLPFRKNKFKLVIALDVLEHLGKPKDAIEEIYHALQKTGWLVTSLPLENFFQRTSRVGFMIWKASGDFVLRRHQFRSLMKHAFIKQSPSAHYAGTHKSYDSLLKSLRMFFRLLDTRYAPMGFHKSININAINIFTKD